MRARFPPRHLLFGALMGAAEIVPGVSGGTVALIVGIYERLIESIRNGAGALLAAVRDRATARARWAAVEWSLVLPLAAGVLSALVVGTLAIPPLLERYPVEVNAVFFGFVAGSIPVPWNRMGARRARHVLIVAASALVAFVLVGVPPADVGEPSLPRVLLSAAFAISAMILPGVSGAFLLRVLGIYESSLGAARDLDVVYVGVFTLGAVVGLGLFAKLLSWLLRRYEHGMMAVLVGLMTGALRALWPWQGEDRGLLVPPAEAVTAVAVALALASCATVLLLTRGGTRELAGTGGPGEP